MEDLDLEDVDPLDSTEEEPPDFTAAELAAAGKRAAKSVRFVKRSPTEQSARLASGGKGLDASRSLGGLNTTLARFP